MDDINIVENWVKSDPVRWFSGAIGGVIAGTAAFLLAMWLASLNGYEAVFPIKFMALPILGPSATAVGPSEGAIGFGILVAGAICVFFGVVYAHFVRARTMIGYMAMGLVWGVFSWIFIWNLFMQSIKAVNAAHLGSGVMMPICLTYGFFLFTVGFIDRVLKGA